MDQSRVVQIPERYALGLLLPGAAKPIIVDGRVAKMVAWLVQHKARIERVGTGSLAFHMGLRDFQPEIRESFPRLQATPEDPDAPLPRAG